MNAQHRTSNGQHWIEGKNPDRPFSPASAGFLYRFLFHIRCSMLDVRCSMFILFRTVARLLGFVSLYPTYIFYQEPPDWYSSPGGFHLIPPAFPIPSTRLPLPWPRPWFRPPGAEVPGKVSAAVPPAAVLAEEAGNPFSANNWQPPANFLPVCPFRPLGPILPLF